MLSRQPAMEPTVGFLTVIEKDGAGWLGGYLVLNQRARPVEFHCTAPIKPNRAQEILYGPTLRPFVYGEQIGTTLIQKAKSKPQLIFTDTAPAMSARDLIKTPMGLVGLPTAKQPSEPGDINTSHRLDGAHSTTLSEPHWVYVQLGENEITLQPQHADDQALIVRHWTEMELQLDLSEPFERVHQALAEAYQDA